MEILKFSEPPKRNRRGRTKTTGMSSLVAVAIGVLLLGGMSTTLAGTISLNGGSTVEFGQGVVTTAACDPSITVTPTSSYDTSTGFSVTGVTFSNIADTCAGKYMTVKAYSSTAQLNVNAAGTYTFFKVKIPTSNQAAGSWDKPSVDGAVTWTNTAVTGSGTWSSDLTSSTGGFTVTRASNTTEFKIDKSLDKITVESSDS